MVRWRIRFLILGRSGSRRRTVHARVCVSAFRLPFTCHGFQALLEQRSWPPSRVWFSSLIHVAIAHPIFNKWNDPCCSRPSLRALQPPSTSSALCVLVLRQSCIVETLNPSTPFNNAFFRLFSVQISVMAIALSGFSRMFAFRSASSFSSFHEISSRIACRLQRVERLAASPSKPFIRRHGQSATVLWPTFWFLAHVCVSERVFLTRPVGGLVESALDTQRSEHRRRRRRQRRVSFLAYGSLAD